MVKAVTGEEAQLKLLEDRLGQSGVICQVGLVIGKISPNSDRGFVFDLVPTPPNDAGESPCSIVEVDKRKVSKSAKSQTDSSSSLSVDKEWVSEHARQVSRMLLGGMKVVGIYIWANENAFKNSTVVLCQTVQEVGSAAPLMGHDWDERLLIHISYSPRRFPIVRENGSNLRKYADILRHVISAHAKELKGAKALVDGKLVKDGEQSTLDDQHEVEFLLPFMQDTFLEVCSQKEVVGVLVFCGSICSFAFLTSKEPFSQALTDIKGDIITSLENRLDILCDEADGELDSVADDGGLATKEMSSEIPIPQHDLQLLRKVCSLSFPRRVFVPWLAGTYVCDYIQPSETLEVIKDHCVELMSMEAPIDVSKILEPEAESTSSLVISTESFWDKTISSSKPTTSSLEQSITNTSLENDGKSAKSVNFNIWVSLLVLILSVIIGIVLLVIR